MSTTKINCECTSERQQSAVVPVVQGSSLVFVRQLKFVAAAINVEESFEAVDSCASQDWPAAENAEVVAVAEDAGQRAVGADTVSFG